MTRRISSSWPASALTEPTRSRSSSLRAGSGSGWKSPARCGRPAGAVRGSAGSSAPAMASANSDHHAQRHGADDQRRIGRLPARLAQIRSGYRMCSTRRLGRAARARAAAAPHENTARRPTSIGWPKSNCSQLAAPAAASIGSRRRRASWRRSPGRRASASTKVRSRQPAFAAARCRSAEIWLRPSVRATSRNWLHGLLLTSGARPDTRSAG